MKKVNLSFLHICLIKLHLNQMVWELDLNQRPSGYEPDELPDCSIPQQHIHCIHQTYWLLSLVRKGDLNPHAPKHYHLKVACLPIPPPPQLYGTHSMPLNRKRKGLIQLIQSFLARLVKFQAMLQARSLLFVRILNYMHLWFVFSKNSQSQTGCKK